MEYNKKFDQHVSEKIELTPFFEYSLDLLCVAGFDGYFKKISPSVSNLLGYSNKELYSKPINEFIHPDDVKRTDSIRDKLRNNSPITDYENRYITKDGRIVWLYWTAIPIIDEKYVYAIAKDITQKKIEEEYKNQVLLVLEKTNQRLKQISATTSHDLRSPVNNLMSVFSLMDLSKINDPEILEFIDILKSSTNGLLNTLNTYVDKLGMYGEILVEEVSFEATFEKVEKSISSIINETKTVFENDFSKSPVIRFNKSFLESILLNLITNAIKYSKPNKSPKIKIESKQELDSTVLVFSDNGIGIDIELVKDRIFGLNQKFTDHPDSKGVGLFLVKNHITSLGGSISVDSKIGEGTSFILTFPNPIEK